MSSVYRPTPGELTESLLKRCLAPLVFAGGLAVAVRFAWGAGRPVWYLIAVSAGALAVGWLVYGLFTAYRAVDRRQRVPPLVRARNVGAAVLAVLLVLTGLIALPWHAQRSAEQITSARSFAHDVSPNVLYPLGDRLYGVGLDAIDVFDRHSGSHLAHVPMDSLTGLSMGLTSAGDIALWSKLDSWVYSGRDGHEVLRVERGGRVVAAKDGTYVVQNCKPRIDDPPCTYTGYAAGGRVRWRTTGMALASMSLLRTENLGPGLEGGYTPNQRPPTRERVRLPQSLVVWTSPMWSPKLKHDSVQVLDAATGHRLARFRRDLGSWAASGGLLVRSTDAGPGCRLTAVTGASWTITIPGGCGSAPLRPMVIGDRIYAAAGDGGISVDMRTGEWRRIGRLRLRDVLGSMPQKIRPGTAVVGADTMIEMTARGVTASDPVTGQQRWHVDLPGVTRAAIGYGGVVLTSSAPARPLRRRDEHGMPAVVTVLRASTGEVCDRFEVADDLGQAIAPVGPGRAAVVRDGREDAGLTMVGCRD